MIVKGRKFIELSRGEKNVLTDAIKILESLADEVGEELDEYYDITNTAEQIASIRDVDEFTIELGEDY